MVYIHRTKKVALPTYPKHPIKLNEVIAEVKKYIKFKSGGGEMYRTDFDNVYSDNENDEKLVNRM